MLIVTDIEQLMVSREMDLLDSPDSNGAAAH